MEEEEEEEEKEEEKVGTRIRLGLKPNRRINNEGKVVKANTVQRPHTGRQVNFEATMATHATTICLLLPVSHSLGSFHSFIRL